ncbi:MAG: hypothetical protein ACFWTN_08910 [Clostridium sp.]|jgi:putative aldouronate transport system permease protein
MKKSAASRAFDVFNVCLMTLLVILTVYPIFNQAALSLSGTTAIVYICNLLE